jgi:hypothetical protein
VPRPSPRSGILSSKAMDRSDKSGDAAWVGMGEGLQPLPPWSLIDLICKQGRGDINS